MIKTLKMKNSKGSTVSFAVTKEKTEDDVDVVVARNGDEEYRFSPNVTDEELKMLASGETITQAGVEAQNE